MNVSSSHLSTETLADLAEDRLEAKARETALAHVSTCARCDTALIPLRKVVRLMRSDRAENVPKGVLAAAINILQTEPQPPAHFSLHSVVATLIFDSLNSMPAFGMRSGQTASRQLLYSAEDTDLDLRITVQDEQCVVAGQVLRDKCVEGLVEIFGSTGSAQASLNELCEFTLPAVPVGSYLLKVRMGDFEIKVPELKLTA